MFGVILKIVAPYLITFMFAYSATVLVIKVNINRHTLPIPEPTAAKPPKMGVMDTILIIEGVAILVYVVVDFMVFWHTGSEPSALTMGFFAVCGGENGFMAWIKTQKEQERMRKWQLEDEERMQGQVMEPEEGDEEL